jgi:hypothetical protein
MNQITQNQNDFKNQLAHDIQNIQTKRKYSRNQNIINRNQTILQLFQNGTPIKNIAQQFNMTHQNASLIINSFNIKPQQIYIQKLKLQAASNQLNKLQIKQSKQNTKYNKIQLLSNSWINNQNIQEFMKIANLKSLNSAHVKLTLLRKKFGLLMFPLKNKKTTTNTTNTITVNTINNQQPEQLEQLTFSII